MVFSIKLNMQNLTYRQIPSYSKKAMSFLRAFKSSVYDPAFYKKVQSKSLGWVLKYFFLLIFVLALLNTLFLSYELLVKIPFQAQKLLSELINSYPSELKINIDKGQVSTNAQQPYFVSLPKNTDEQINPESLNNILVIDTNTPFSSTQFNQYKTFFWLTKDSLFYQNRGFDQRSLDLSEVDNLKIDRGVVQNIANKIQPLLNILGPILLIIFFIGLFIAFTFNLIYLLLLAVLIFLLSSIFKWGLNYMASYKIAILSSTLSYFVDLILFNTGIYTGFFGFPFLFTLTSLCIATINLQNFEQKR